MRSQVVATVVEKHGVSLLKSAVADGNVAVVNRVMGIMGNEVSRREYLAMSIRWGR